MSAAARARISAAQKKRWGKDNRCQRNNRVSKPSKRVRHSGLTLVNSTPIASPGTLFRTIAFARTIPPGTSKTMVSSEPTRRVTDPERNRPPCLTF
jgi:hypothetical protein